VADVSLAAGRSVFVVPVRSSTDRSLSHASNGLHVPILIARFVRYRVKA
jgi:hypothetical protein